MPNNRIGWGQGSVNNTIGWGSAATTNSIGFGRVGDNSYGHDETNLVGNYGAAMAIVLKADGGTILSLPCLDVLGAQIYDPST